MEGAEEARVCARGQALLTRCEALLADHPPWKRQVIMMRLDQPSIKLLRGKNRYHVLFKLMRGPDAEALCAALSDLAREDAPGTETYFEYNPTTMM